MVTSEFLDPALLGILSTLAHYGSGWVLSLTTESALMHVTLIVSLQVVAVR